MLLVRDQRSLGSRNRAVSQSHKFGQARKLLTSSVGNSGQNSLPLVSEPHVDEPPGFQSGAH